LSAIYVFSQLSSLGLSKEKEKDELEPWLIQEMDQCLSEIWLSGSEEKFPQVFYLIASENVSGMLIVYTWQIVRKSLKY
jgi:hypothetical protein